MPKIQFFYVFLTSLFTSLVLIPSISRLAVSIGIFDAPDDRKTHTRAIPRLGGIAIFFAVLLGVILFTEIDRNIRGFLAGAVVIFLTGLTDDLDQISPKKKFLGEIVAALVLSVVGGVRLTTLGDPFGWGEISLGYFSIPFTVFAVVGVINAINLLDGLDGLAGGVSAIAAAALGMLGYMSGDYALVGVCAALLGGILGFLKFNTYPAQIFMGDGGSLFLGYSLAFMSVYLTQHGAGVGEGSVLTPLIILAVPVFDTLFVMGKRLFSGKGIFQPDRTHIHHRFLGLGLGHKASVIMIYGLSYFLAVYAVMFRNLPDQQQLLNLALLLAFFCLAHSVLGHLLAGQQHRFLQDDQSLLKAFSYRRMVRYSKYFLVCVKYIMLAILLLPVFTFAGSGSIETSSTASLLIILAVMLFIQAGNWSDQFLQIILYFNVAYLIFVVENHGRSLQIAGLPLPLLSSIMFGVLFLCSLTLMLMRRKSKLVIDSPLEYIVLFVAITIPLLPDYFTEPIHLLTVAGKSLILFLGFKMVFLLDVRPTRRLIAAPVAALLFVALRGLI